MARDRVGPVLQSKIKPGLKQYPVPGPIKEDRGEIRKKETSVFPREFRVLNLRIAQDHEVLVYAARIVGDAISRLDLGGSLGFLRRLGCRGLCFLELVLQVLELVLGGA